MNSFRLRSCLTAAALSTLSLTLVGHANAATIKVACLGEQTTKSNEVAASTMWPSLLGVALGANYTVVDDAGDTSGSILTGYNTNGVGADPVMATTNAAYEDSLTANIVVIGPFGEHDQRVVSKFPALGTEMVFEQDYDALVQSYLTAPSKPTVYVTTPIQVPTFDQATQTLVSSVVLPAVQAVAMKRSVTLIDLYTAFSGHTEYFMGMGDGQTNAVGEMKIEQMVADAIKAAQAGGMGGASGSAGAGGGAGASAGGSGGASGGGVGGTGGATSAGTGGASGGAAGAAGSGTSAAGTSPQPIDESPSNDTSGCSVVTGATVNGNGLAWLGVAGAFSGLALGRMQRRRARR